MRNAGAVRILSGCSPASAPPLLPHGSPAVWATGRAVAGPMGAALIVGSLIAPAGLPEIPADGALRDVRG
jgi:hypothetical protein